MVCADAHPPEIIVEHSGNLATKVLQKNVVHTSDNEHFFQKSFHSL